MNKVKTIIDRTLDNRGARRELGDIRPTFSTSLRPEARLALRKMMNAYWDNGSVFGVELNAAVMRQGIFVEKMNQIDWLHSPEARATMTRLIAKYHRFMTIMKENPEKLCVPTLDVDLAWHTHQLCPASYYKYTVENQGKFIDHDDKIGETMLGFAFEWTTKTYQDKYNMIYSECTCWYCEGKLQISTYAHCSAVVLTNISCSHISHPHAQTGLGNA